MKNFGMAAFVGGIAFAAVTSLAPASASASLIYLGTVGDQGSGIGNVSTLISLRPTANNTDACGSITRSGGSDVLAACNDTPTQFAGGVNNQTRTFAEAGITDADQFRLILNINEPGTDGFVTLQQLEAYFYNSAGVLYHTATLAGLPTTFDEAGGGIGGQGHLFGLDAAQILLVNAQFSTQNRIGLLAELANASGGFETFNVGMANGNGTDPDPVPEPTAMALLGLGLLGAGIARRRRRQ